MEQAIRNLTATIDAHVKQYHKDMHGDGPMEPGLKLNVALAAQRASEHSKDLENHQNQINEIKEGEKYKFRWIMGIVAGLLIAIGGLVLTTFFGPKDHQPVYIQNKP